VAPLLWLKAGARGRRIDTVTEGYEIADTYGILFDLDATSDFLKSLVNTPVVGMAFIVTDDERSYQAICGDMPEEIKAVRLYSSYLTNFTINTGRD